MATEPYPHQQVGSASIATELNPLSCEVCRRRKTKCDRRLPACSHCVDARVDCHYPEARQRGPQVGYLSILESRLVATEVALYETLARLHGQDGTPTRSPDELSLCLQKKYADMPYSAKTADWNQQPLTGDHNLSRWWLDRRQLFEAQPVPNTPQQASNSPQHASDRPQSAARRQHSTYAEMAAPTWTSPTLKQPAETRKRRAPSLSSIHSVDTGEGGLRNMYAAASDAPPAPTANMMSDTARSRQEGVNNIDPALAAQLGPEQSRKYF